MLNEVNEKYAKIEDLESYNKWCDNTKVFSHAELENYYKENPSKCIKKVLDWSKTVNEEIKKLKPEEKNAFKGAKEDVTEVVLNMKGLAVKIDSDD